MLVQFDHIVYTVIFIHSIPLFQTQHGLPSFLPVLVSHTAANTTSFSQETVTIKGHRMCLPKICFFGIRFFFYYLFVFVCLFLINKDLGNISDFPLNSLSGLDREPAPGRKLLSIDT